MIIFRYFFSSNYLYSCRKCVRQRNGGRSRYPYLGHRQFASHNKASLWNENSQVYQLDFGGRVSQESAKNFQIEFRSRQVCPYKLLTENWGFICNQNYLMWQCDILLHSNQSSFLLFLQAIRNSQQKSSKKFFLKYKRDYIVLQYNTFN